MKLICEYLLYGLAGLGLVLGAGYWFSVSGFDFRQLLMLVVGAGLVAAAVALLKRDAKDELKRGKKARQQKQGWNKAVRVETELPFDHLAANFRELEKKTDEVVAEPAYLSWNSGAAVEIRIEKLDNDGWVAIFWLRSPWHYTDTQLATICRSEGIAIPAGFKKMQAHGLAVYRQGSLSLYPATQKEQFEEAFFSTLLQPEEGFRQWLAEYTEEG
ncbi:MAG: hypothetical protein IJO38_09755 [Akkermansia sp.]|nr:hypothetical protein [Akkermansia sp.]